MALTFDFVFVAVWREIVSQLRVAIRVEQLSQLFRAASLTQSPFHSLAAAIWVKLGLI